MNHYDPNWVTEFFDEYADKEWYRWEEALSQEVSFCVHRHWLEQHVKRGDRVLEVGAGAGRFTQVLAALKVRIVVADISAVQLDLNRRHAEELEFEQAVEERVQLDMCDMSMLDDGSFDVVVCYGGPLSYVFERRDVALREILRVLKKGGKALLSVMSLWGGAHHYLPAVLALPPTDNAEIIRTGDLCPETVKESNHNCHMFRSSELWNLLEEGGAEVLNMSASNCLSAVWGDSLDGIRDDSAKWSELLKMELEACQQPGCLDLGTHMIAVVRKKS